VRSYVVVRSVVVHRVVLRSCEADEVRTLHDGRMGEVT
jgi:hypothetical protein